MKATKKNLLKIEKYVAGIRELTPTLNIPNHEATIMEKKLEVAEMVIRTIANLLKN